MEGSYRGTVWNGSRCWREKSGAAKREIWLRTDRRGILGDDGGSERLLVRSVMKSTATVARRCED